MFYKNKLILVSPNPLKAFTQAFQWLHCAISISMALCTEHADNLSQLLD